MPARPLQCATLLPSFPAMRRDLALCEHGWSRTNGPAQPYRLLLSMEIILTPLPPFPVTHRLQLSLTNADGIVSKKQKQRCDTKSDSGKCVQSFKYLPLLVGPWGQPHLWGAPLHSVPRKEGKFCMDPLKHQPLSASSSKEENQSSKQKRFILQQLYRNYRNNLKQLRGGPEKQQLLRVCVGGNQEVQAL